MTKISLDLPLLIKFRSIITLDILAQILLFKISFDFILYYFHIQVIREKFSQVQNLV